MNFDDYEVEKKYRIKEFIDYIRNLEIDKPILIKKNKDGEYIINKPRPARIIKND